MTLLDKIFLVELETRRAFTTKLDWHNSYDGVWAMVPAWTIVMVGSKCEMAPWRQPEGIFAWVYTDYVCRLHHHTC